MRCYLFLPALACAIAWPVAASTQTTGLFGNRGAVQQNNAGISQSVGSVTGGRGMTSGNSSRGMTSTGGSSFGNSSTGGSSFGGSSFGNSSVGGSSFGGSGLGGSAFGNNMGGMSGNGMTGRMGMQTGNNPFVGQSQNMGRQIGVARAGQQSTMGALQALQGLQGLQRGGGFNNNNNNQRSSQEERLPLRPTQRIAFDYNGATPSVAAQRASTKLGSIVDRRPELADVTVTSDDSGNIVLRGNVATEEAAQLAAALVRLEPGVRDVVVDVTIGEAP